MIDQLPCNFEAIREAGRDAVDHLEGNLSYCRLRIAMGVVEAISGNITSLLRRGYGGACRNQVVLAAQDTAEFSAKTQ